MVKYGNNIEQTNDVFSQSPVKGLHAFGSKQRHSYYILSIISTILYHITIFMQALLIAYSTPIMLKVRPYVYYKVGCQGDSYFSS